MQFSFKRPQTSKSVCTFYRDKSRERGIPRFNAEAQVEVNRDSNQVKRWETAAQKINKQMVLHKILHYSGEPFRALSKIGGKVYNSQPKFEATSEERHKPGIRISSKEKKHRQNVKQSRVMRQTQREVDLQPEIKEVKEGELKLKKKRRNEHFRSSGRPLERDLKVNNIFYESPAIKIGYNMQFEANLRFEHISQIRQDHGGSICRNSIIFFLKDAPFNPNIISELNKQIPIALSLFPQFFDSKLSASDVKRKAYLQRMLEHMNGTYDPERMNSMRRFSAYPEFNNRKYFQTVEGLVVGCEKSYKVGWLENIIEQLGVKLSEQQFKQLLEQQWEFFNIANAIAALDYILKDPNMSSKLAISPYLPTRVITSKRILYHGGYCRSLYPSWSTYVDTSKRKLAARLHKYNTTTQSIFGWYCHFEPLQLYESSFASLLQESLSIDLFQKIQQSKLKYSQEVLQQLWFRGVLCLYHFSKFLMKRHNEYESLINYSKSLSLYIGQAKQRVKELKNGQEINQFYLNFYDNFINSLRRESSIAAIDQLLPAVKGEQKPALANIQVLLGIQLGRTVEKSFAALKRQINECSAPLLKLNLIIDRQTIKFLEQEQDIINTFIEIIKNILGIQIQGYALNCMFEKKHQNLYEGLKKPDNLFQQEQKNLPTKCPKEYPQISEAEYRNSLDEEKEIKITYRSAFIFDEQISQLLDKIRHYFKECFLLLNQFEMYLPFIKLTTTQKIFSEGEGASVEQSFLKNLRIIAKYKDSMASLQQTVKVNLFEVDCSIPIKILAERINEIEYIIEQNYMNLIHERIESIDSELNSLKIAAHNLSIKTTNIESMEDKLLEIKHNIKLLQNKCRKVAEMIMFCLDNRRKTDTIVTCFCQLITKKQDLQQDIEAIYSNLEAKRPEVEAEIEFQISKIIENIAEAFQNVAEIETTCFEFANIPEYISSLKQIGRKFEQIGLDVDKYQESALKLQAKKALEEKIELFQRQKMRFELIILYWEQFHSFESYFKEASKLEVKKIDYQQFMGQVDKSQSVISKIKSTERQLWEKYKDKTNWKPIIHKTHDYYSKKFNNDVESCQKLQPHLKILTNQKIKQRHWQLYKLTMFQNISFRELAKMEEGSHWEQLVQMDKQVNFEHEIYLAYEQIQKQIRSHKLLIIDLNNSDVLDLNNLERCVQFLHNVEIEIEELIQRDTGGYQTVDLNELLILANVTLSKLEQWRMIELRYIKFLKYHITNEEYEQSHFSNLIELHRKLIKSYDIDNSIVFISKNIVMDSYLSQIREEIEELNLKVVSSFSISRAQYPRLYLLDDEELFDFMSSGSDTCKYLKKCFPQILAFDLKEGSIQRVGLNKELVFVEPLYIQQMIGRVNSWTMSLDQLIKGRMREFFKTNLVLLEGKSAVELEANFYENFPLQLSILDECISFTIEAEEAITNNTLGGLLQKLQSRIEYLIKERKQVGMILLLITFREIVKKLCSTKDLDILSFQWLKYSRFYHKNLMDVRVAFLNQENSYNFNYLEKSEIIHTDNVLIGNCLVGPAKFSKSALVKYQAYLCGQELLVFDPQDIDHHQSCTAALLNYFKVNSYVGNWLLLQRIDLLSEDQLKLAAECLFSVQQSIKRQTNKMTISGQELLLNKNSRVFMSLLSLDIKMPARLCVLLRPVWMVKPNRRKLLECYLQSKCVNSIDVGKIMKFCSWLDHHSEISLQLVNWIRQYDDIQLFSNSMFYRKASDLGLFQQESHHLLEALKEEDEKTHTERDELFSNLENDIVTHDGRDILLYSQRGCGKTYEILSMLKGNSYILIDTYNVATADLYQIVRELKGRQGYTHLVIKHGIPFYPLIKHHFRDWKVILVEVDLAHLQQGVIQHLHFVNYLKRIDNCQTKTTLEVLLWKIFPSQQNREVHLMLTGKTVFVELIVKLISNVGQVESINQIHFNFLKIFKSMIEEQYSILISFTFAIFWTYAFYLEEKKVEELFRELYQIKDSNLSKFKKINVYQPTSIGQSALKPSLKKLEESFVSMARQIFENKLVPLTEIIPLKNGRFISSAESMNFIGALRDIELFPQKIVRIHSNLTYNVMLIRQFFDGTIVIDSRDWLTTLLKTTQPETNSQDTRFYNFGNKSPSNIFKILLNKIKRTKYTYSFPRKTNIIIDDVYLCAPQTINNLRNVTQYGFTIYCQSGKDQKAMINMVKFEGCNFVMGSKYGYPSFPKALTIKIQEINLNAIFNEFVQSYCQNNLRVDRSIFALLNLSNNINRIYRDRQDKYFWFKNPLILLQQVPLIDLTGFLNTYIDYLAEILPDEKQSLVANRALLELPNDSEDSEVDQDEVINTNKKFSKYYNQSKLIEDLVADNEILEQIQSKQVESIFFQKFIKNYFTKDILEYVMKVNRYLECHHLLLLTDHFSHAQRIVKYSCKISNLQMVNYQNEQNMIGNSVFFLDLDHCQDELLETIENTIKLGKKQNPIENVKYVLKGNIQSQRTRYLFNKFPFLKSHFLNIVLRSSVTPSLPSDQAVESNNNIIEETYHGKYFEQLEELCEAHSLDNNFKDQFIKCFEHYRKQQLANLQFYRKITSEMILNIDIINKAIKSIPTTMNEIGERFITLKIDKKRAEEQIVELKVRLEKWQRKEKIYSELVKYRREEEENSFSRLNQACPPLFSKLDKIQKKIEATDSIEFTRLKNNLKNNENINLIQPLHYVLAIIHEKGQNLIKDKLSQLSYNAISSSGNLVSHLRSIRKREESQCQGQKPFISQQTKGASGMGLIKIKYFLSRMDEITQNAKKYEKVSLIYKSLTFWLSIFQSVCLNMRDYYEKQEEIEMKVTAELTNANATLGEEADVQYIKKNIQTLVINSQNMIEEIKSRIKLVEKGIIKMQKQDGKLVRSERLGSQRMLRLEKISKLFVESSYMKKISSGVSLYFKNMERIIFSKTLLKIGFNEWLPKDNFGDFQLIKGVFTFQPDLYNLRYKHNAHNCSLEELEIIQNLLEPNSKVLSLVEDRNSTIKAKLIEIAETKRFDVKKFRHSNYAEMLKYLQCKIGSNNKIIILHENVHYLEMHQPENQSLMYEFIQKILALSVKVSNAQIIYITNYLPKVSSDLYPFVNFGKMAITRQKFMSDLCEIFSVVLQKELPQEAGGDKKRATDIEVVIRLRNSKFKQLLSNIEVLANSLSGDHAQEPTTDEINNERDQCMHLQNNLINLTALEEDVQILQKYTTSFIYQPRIGRQAIGRQLEKYLCLFEFVDHLNSTSNNQFFNSPEFYREWLDLLKSIREEKLYCFNRAEFRQIINEIVIRTTDNAEEKKQEENKDKNQEESQHISIDQVLNPTFKKYNSEIFNYLVQKIIRNTNWIDKASLTKFTLAACVIVAYSQPSMAKIPIPKLIGHFKRQNINEECVKILKLLGQEHSKGYEMRILHMSEEFIDLVEGSLLQLDAKIEVRQIAVFYYLYLLTLCTHDSKPGQFLMKFSNAASSNKSILERRYAFIKLIKDTKLQSEVVLRLTPPLNLSLNLETKNHDREKLITIIEQEDYLLNDLIELLKVKALAKKRELISMLIDLDNKQSILEQLNHYYKSAGKQWVLLSNISVTTNNHTQIRLLLQEIVSELSRLSHNPYFRIFIVLNRQQENQHSLYYNKYQVNRIKSYHELSNDQYYASINQLILNNLYQCSTDPALKIDEIQTFGKSLMQHLVLSTLNDDGGYRLSLQRLNNLLIFYSRAITKYYLFKLDDSKIYYKNLAEELSKLGYLKGTENQLNFYLYLAKYFINLRDISPQSIKQQIQAHKELEKEGINEALIMQQQNIQMSNLEQQLFFFEKIYVVKMEEYFKNINPEFVNPLKKEIRLNNDLLAYEQVIIAMKKVKGIPNESLRQAIRNLHLRYGILTDGSAEIRPNVSIIRQRLPLIRLLNNLKLKQICNIKKVDVQTSAEFYIFLTAFQNKGVWQFLSQKIGASQTQRKYSISNGQGGNFMNTRDYVTRMKVFLIDVESYREIELKYQDVSDILKEKNKVNSQFMVVIRKIGPQKISELNEEHNEVERILQNYCLTLTIGGEFCIEVSPK